MPHPWGKIMTVKSKDTDKDYLQKQSHVCSHQKHQQPYIRYLMLPKATKQNFSAGIMFPSRLYSLSHLTHSPTLTLSHCLPVCLPLCPLLARLSLFPNFRFSHSEFPHTAVCLSRIRRPSEIILRVGYLHQKPIRYGLGEPALSRTAS